MSRLRTCVRLLLALLVLASLAPALARADDASFDSASAAFAEERFDDAARELEALIVERGYSAAALYDLGRSYAASGQPALAILALERARLLEPRDEAIGAALADARAAAGIDAPIGSAPEELASLLPARAWLTIGAAALSLFCLAAVLAGAFRRGRGLAIVTSLASACAVAAAGAALSFGALATDRAVVVRERAVARVAPFAEADAVFALRPGELVRVEGARGEHLRVAAQGREGWVAREAIERVVPAEE